jgi:DMSO reductase anchor subunit
MTSQSPSSPSRSTTASRAPAADQRYHAAEAFAMTNSSSRAAESSFHEWPLVVFTTLAIMGAGLLATPLVAWLSAGTPAPAAPAIRWGALLLGAGLAVSIGHLGRPLRAPLAPFGLGRSRLSAEIVAACLALALGIVTAMLPYVSPVLDVATAAAAVAFLITLGLVYDLPGQQTWRGAAVWMPLTSGLGFAAVALAGMWGGSTVAIGAVAAVILAADTALLVLRRVALAWPREPLAPRFPRFFDRRQALLGARFALVDVLPGCCLLAGLPRAAACLLGLGILVDRVGFYGLASQHTTESEVHRVEGIIAS